MSVTLYDDFAQPVGEFPGYETYSIAQRTQLALQKHADIRSFEKDPLLIPYTMWVLDHMQIADIDGLTMGILDDGAVLRVGENWSAGVVGPQADRRYFNGISLDCPIGVTPTISVLAPIDLSAFTTGDFISLALPALPLASLTPAQCFLDITSNSTGDFGTGPTASLAFSTSITTLIAGDSEARFPFAALAGIDTSRITGVRFRITATGDCTFRCLAIRCLAASWEYGAIDLNTLYKRMGATVPPSGSLTQPYSFPGPPPYTGGLAFPPNSPILLRADGRSGPALVDMEIGTVIKTGANQSDNTYTQYFRELPMLVRRMNALDNFSMRDLATLHRQPDYLLGNRDDYQTTRSLLVTLDWGTFARVTITDERGGGYTFNDLSLEADLYYYLLVTLEDSSLRVQIYPTTDNGETDFNTVVFDSTAVIDTSFIQRRRGRYGWWAQLGDGNTYLESLRPRRAVYSEYRSAPLRSDTPVEGARLYVSGSPDKQLYNGAIGTPRTVLSPDVTKSRSGRCIKVQCDGTLPLQGISTSILRFEDFYDTEIEFDVLAPHAARLTALLAGEGRLKSLYMPVFPADRWTHISIPLTALGATTLPGPYALYIIQAHTAPNTFYLDNFSVHPRAVAWAGRGQAADPWLMNDPAWIEFGDALNDPYNGALLGRGNALQVRGQVLTPDGTIDSLKILPQYSSLGNFVWDDQRPNYLSSPVASFTRTAHSSVRFECDASASTASEGIAAYHWIFGDGAEGYGVDVVHDYPVPDTYVINLTVTDRLGQETSIAHSVTST